MIEFYVKPYYQKIALDPVLSVFQKVDAIKPHRITIAALCFGMCAAICLSYHHIVASVILLLLSGYCDSLDGALARLNACASPSGAVLDIVSDRVVEFSMLLALFLITPESRGLAVIVMLGAYIFMCNQFFSGCYFSAK